MTDPVQKTPSYLKGLAETRARADATASRCATMISETIQFIDRARQELAEAEASLLRLQDRKEFAEKERDSCDVLIRSFDGRLNPEKIEPIAGWKGRYGKRGALKATVLAYMKERAPEPVSIRELSLAVRTALQMPAMLSWEESAWQENSLRPALRDFQAKGMVARIETPSNTIGFWVWVADKSQPKPSSPAASVSAPRQSLTLEDLRRQADTTRRGASASGAGGST